MTHAQMCETTSVDAIVVQDSQNIALFGHKVALCYSHRCDIATVLRGGGSQPWHMHRCVTQTSGNATVVQDSQNIT